MAHEEAFLDAVTRGDVPGVTDLLRTEPALARHAGAHGKTGLHWAAEKDHAEVARLLLDAGAELEARTTWGDTSLTWAAVMGSVAVADLLLARGASGLTLEAAAGLGKLDVVRAMIESGADHLASQPPPSPDAADEWPPDTARMRGDVRSNALYAAARNGHTRVVACLLDAGADVNAKGFFGATGLHWAAINRHGETVGLLLARGANPAIRDARFDGTAEDWALEGGHPDIAAMLHDCGSVA